jgi:ubiquinone/menaquinone biosynthesis C-methylase UbiE
MFHLNDLLAPLGYNERRAVLKDFYTDAYKLGIYRPTGTRYIWPFILKRATFNKALDVGCGIGDGIRYCRDNGLEAFGCDIASSLEPEWGRMGISQYCKIGDILDLPYEDNSFDLVNCNDVFEHIPAEDVPQALKEIYRVGSDKYCLVACTSEESIPVMRQIHSHITVKPGEWWQQKILEAGFNILTVLQQLTKESVTHYGVFAVKDLTPYTNGEKHIKL